MNAQAANRGLTAVQVFALAVDPAAPATVYAGTDIGLFKSTDAGATWTSVAVGPYVTRVLCLAILPGSSAILAGMDDGGWRSTDGGATWTHLDTASAWSTRGRWTPDRRRPSTPPGGRHARSPPPRRKESRGRAPTAASRGRDTATRTPPFPSSRASWSPRRGRPRPSGRIPASTGSSSTGAAGTSGSRTTRSPARSSTRSPWIRAPLRPSGRARTGGCSDRRTAA